MAKKLSIEEPDVDSGELSEKELERKRRQEARREEKRQKQELRRIEREMKEPVSKWVWVSVAVIIVLLGAISWGGFVFWSSYTANLQRKSFMDNYNVADLSMLRRYAPDQFQRLEELKTRAENTDGILSHGEVVDAYRKAEDALGQAQAAARDNADAYEAALKRFQTLRQEAIKYKLDEHATRLWEQVEEAQKAATEKDTRDFSATLATEKLNQAIAVLIKAADSYPQIQQFDITYNRFKEAFTGLSEQECRRNVADKWSTVQTRINRAQAAREASNWEQATRLYAEATDIIPSIKTTVSRLKTEAREAIEVMKQGLTAGREQNMPRDKPEAWQRIQREARKAQEAFDQYNYQTATETAQQVTSLLGQAGESARQAQQTLANLKKEIGTLYDKARQAQDFFTRNYGDQWDEIEQRVQRLPELDREKNTFDMVEVTQTLRDDLQKLLNERDRVFSDLKSARQRLEDVTNAPLFRFLEANYPADSQKILELRQTAQRRLEQADMREARDLLKEAADTAENLLKRLGDTRTTVLRLRADISRRRQDFTEGMRRFMPGELRGIQQRFGRLERLIENNLYSAALEQARELSETVPESRFVPQDNQTVIDFKRGVMWIADGTSETGGNGGRKLDWYAALNWADNITFAGRTDWRLPTPEELRDIHRLPGDRREKLLPNTFEDVHWTSLPSQDVNRALAVDVATGRTSRESKQKAFHVRAVSQPGLP